MKEIDDIVNGNYTVLEKDELLTELFDRFRIEYENAKQKIVEGYKYCPKCKDYYKVKSWENYVKNETREICTFRDLTEFGQDQYECKVCAVKYSECPKGHKIEESAVF